MSRRTPISDILTPFPIKTKTKGDANVKVTDGTNDLVLDASGRPTVNVNGTVPVDSELPTAAALSDTTGNPTAPMVGAAGMLWDGTQWRRAAADSSGNMKVVTGSLVSPKLDTLTSAALAAGANVTVDGTQVASGKTGKLLHAVASASVPMKVEILTKLNGTATVRVVLFTSAASPTVEYEPATKDFITQAESATAGYDGFAVKFTNQDGANAGDVYCSLEWDEV